MLVVLYVIPHVSIALRLMEHLAKRPAHLIYSWKTLQVLPVMLMEESSI